MENTDVPTITIPDIPKSWLEFAKTILQIALLAYMLWTNNKPENVQDKVATVQHVQQANAVKIDEAKDAAESAKAEAAAAKMAVKDQAPKIDAIKGKVAPTTGPK